MDKYEQVFDRSNRRIRGLWKRNDSFYVQTTVVDVNTGLKKLTKIRLEKANTVTEATQAMYDLFKQIEDGETVFGKGGPDFKTYRLHYKEISVKSPKTKYNEDHFLRQWEKFLGESLKVGQITARQVLAYRAKKIEGGLAPRSINLHMRALKQILLLAKREKYISKLPTDGISQIREKHVEKRLLTEEDIVALGTAALKYHDRNGIQFVNVLLLLIYSGGRISETLSLKWDNVDFTNECLVFSGDVTKNSETRRVKFNKNLKNHLLCLKANKNSDYLFPSCRTKNSVTTLKKILFDVKIDAEVLDFHWHLCRHYFISQCVMGGIDYLTIARWVGHKDGGILIGKIYGHLSSEHEKEQAKKLTF